MPEDSELFTSESVGTASYDLAEVYPLSVSSVSTIPWIRRIRGSADLIAGLTIIAAFVVELSDQVRRGEFEPLFHFSYLTNQTNYSNIVVLLAGAYLAFSRTQDYLAADWLIRNNRPRISWNTVWIGVSYPVVWVGVTLLRGAATDWYPYFFLNPNTLGWPGVIAYIIAISIIFAGLIAGMVALNHLQHRRLSTS